MCRCDGIHFKKEEPMKFVSWNINGANSVFNGGELDSTLKLFGADILAFQETKVLRRDRRIVLPGWHDYWSFHKTSESLHPQSVIMISFFHLCLTMNY